jgi:hypothetical protein
LFFIILLGMAVASPMTVSRCQNMFLPWGNGAGNVHVVFIHPAKLKPRHVNWEIHANELMIFMMLIAQALGGAYLRHFQA